MFQSKVPTESFEERNTESQCYESSLAMDFVKDEHTKVYDVNSVICLVYFAAWSNFSGTSSY